MRLFRWGHTGREKPGIVDRNGRHRDLSGVIDDINGTTLSPASLQHINGLDLSDLPVVPPDIRIGPCIGNVRNFLAIGLNYSDHAREANMKVPEEPIVFSKCTSCICGPYDDVIIPPRSEKTDWEVELAVVMGGPAYCLDEVDSMRAVAGYCICNDLSERNLQLERGGQWTKGKSFPTFGPLGPYLVTVEEVEDVHNLSIWLELNGERIQSSSTREMIFNVSEIVSYISHCMRLQPGDVIATGTPYGVGMGMKPQKYLRKGDALRCGIEGFGEQHQRCRDFEGTINTSGN